MEQIPEYADVIEIDDFIEQCEAGLFIDYDGTGYYANPPLMNRLAPARPSDIRKNPFPLNKELGYTHVAWFNK